VLDELLGRALAKDPAARFATAIDMGEAFRVGLGLAPTPEWRAQAEMVRAAKTMAGVGPSTPEAKEAQAPTLATLREFVTAGYRAK
jgi:hypothetical protein